MKSITKNTMKYMLNIFEYNILIALLGFGISYQIFSMFPAQLPIPALVARVVVLSFLVGALMK